MPTLPLVTVIVPTYNRAYCLEQTLQSAFAQSHPALEVIVIDDGSTDDTEALCGRIARSEHRLRYVFQPNAGVSAARNAGIDAAHGEFVAFLDSDDLWKHWKVEAQLAALEKVPSSGMVWTDMEAVDAAGQTIHSRYLRTFYDAYRWFPNERLFSTELPAAGWMPAGIATPACSLFAGNIYSPMIMGNLVHTSTVLLRRERLEAVGKFRPDLKAAGEDYDFHLRTCREGDVAYIDATSILYRIGLADQLTHPKYAWHMAHNFLTTVEGAIERDRERLTLPPQMLAAVRAEAHAWAGEQSLRTRDFRAARSLLVRSLRFRPWQFRIAVLALMTSLPEPVCDVLTQLVLSA
jgi:GT2 family glycosyltransferase